MPGREITVAVMGDRPLAVTEIATHLAALPASTGSTRPERLVADLQATLAETDIATLVAIGGVARPHLQAFLDSYAAQVARLADAVADVHFSTGPAPRSIGSLAIVDSLEAAPARTTP